MQLLPPDVLVLTIGAPGVCKCPLASMQKGRPLKGGLPAFQLAQIGLPLCEVACPYDHVISTYGEAGAK